MREEIKKQLVGLLVLLILFGLLWSLLFSNNRQADNLAPKLDIPKLAPLENILFEEAAPVYPVENTRVLNKSFEKDDDSLDNLIAGEPLPPPVAGDVTHTINTNKRPRLDKNGIPISFLVQVGRFDEYGNADNLRNILIDKYEMKAFLKPSTPSLNQQYTVYLGPVLTYEDALIIKNIVKNDIKINDVFIKRFGDH